MRTLITATAAAAAFVVSVGAASAENVWRVADMSPPMLIYGLPGDGDEVLFSATCPVGASPLEISVHAAVETIPGITVAADGTRNSLDSVKVVFHAGGQAFPYDGAAVQPDDLNGGLSVDVQVKGDDPLVKALGGGGELAVELAGKRAGALSLAGAEKPLETFLKKCAG